MKRNLALFLIILVAFLVRGIGLNFGLPFIYHDDEPIIVNYALAYGTGDFNPHVFMVSPFLSYLLFFIYGLFFIIGYIFKAFAGIKDFAYLYLNNPTIFYIIGRAIYGLLCGTASILLLYLLGKRYFNQTTAVLASLFFSLNYLHVRDSHYIYFDVPLVFFMLVFFIKTADFFKTPVRRSSYIWLGVLLGAVSSVKYAGALLALPFLMVIIYSSYLSKDKKLSVKLADIFFSGAACAAVLFILNPFSFINFNQFIRSISRMPFVQVSPHFHLKVSLFNGCGAALVILGILGVFYSIFIRRNRHLVLACYMFFYYWSISRASQEAERLVMPLVPLILLFAAAMIVDLKSLIRGKALSNGVAFIAVLALLYPSLIRIYYSDMLFLKEDTRTTAYHWIKNNIPKDSRIALDATSSWFPKLKKSKEQIREAFKYFDKPQFDKPRGADSLKLKFMLDNPDYPEKTYYLFYLKETAGTAFLSVHPDMAADYSSLRFNRIRYVVLSHALVDDRYKRFVEDVERYSQLLAVFSPYKKDINRIKPEEASFPPAGAFMLSELKDRRSYGPVIKVYKTRY